MRFAYAAIISLVASVILSYDTAAAQISSGFDVRSAIVAAERQLIELGISPGDAVFQVGARNYAGPNCPGDGWNCTTSSTVVQIGTSGTLSANSFSCQSDSCSVIQPGPGPNDATCNQYSTNPAATQTCNITQTSTAGGTNQAFVNQLILQWQVEGTQTATQNATINQTNGAGGNASAVAQTVGQAESKFVSGPTGATQTQEAHQRLLVCQGGLVLNGPCIDPSTGTNKSDVAQNTFQLASVQFYGVATGTIIQNQNALPFGGSKSGAEIRQNTTNKTNDAALLQFSRQIGSVHNFWSWDEDDSPEATTGFLGPVTQQQGNGKRCGFLGGGMCGFEFQNSTGVQTANERQDEVQRLIGPRLLTTSQIQYGDEFCCATQIGGNNASVNNVSQSKAQFHTSSFTQGNIQGHCDSPSSNGRNCRVNETLNQNGTITNNTCSGASCNISITCTQGIESPPCVPSPTAPPPPCAPSLCSSAIQGPEIAYLVRDEGPASG